MTREHLDDDTRLTILLSATITRHRYDADTAAVIAELRELAGGRDGVLVETAGTWAGYHSEDPHSARLVAALRSLPGAEAWVEEGRRRAGMWHETPKRRG